MPSWDEVLKEVQNKNSVDTVRKNYLLELSKETGRNVILYYSGWLEKPSISGVDINDEDMVGFMTTVNKTDKSKGLDIILHTPGGNPTATEHIVKYLHDIYKEDIRIIIPHMAMSAGTMMACASKEIIMGKHSCLGPVDPQFGGIPAFNIIDEFKEAKKDLTANPNTAGYWKQILVKYPAAFIYTIMDAISLSKILVKEWLEKYMFKNQENNKVINKIVKSLSSNAKSHARHFSLDQCKQMGLKIIELESDNKLQEIVLSIFHACTITMSGTKAIKLIENHNGKSFIKQIG